MALVLQKIAHEHNLVSYFLPADSFDERDYVLLGKDVQRSVDTFFESGFTCLVFGSAFDTFHFDTITKNT